MGMSPARRPHMGPGSLPVGSQMWAIPYHPVCPGQPYRRARDGSQARQALGGGSDVRVLGCSRRPRKVRADGARGRKWWMLQRHLGLVEGGWFLLLLLPSRRAGCREGDGPGTKVGRGSWARTVRLPARELFSSACLSCLRGCWRVAPGVRPRPLTLCPLRRPGLRPRLAGQSAGGERGQALAGGPVEAGGFLPPFLPCPL